MNIGAEILGYLAGICTAVCFLPQTLKTIRSKQVQNLSKASYIIYNLGLGCWLVYGIYLRSIQMVLFNFIGIIFGGIVLYMIFKYQKN